MKKYLYAIFCFVVAGGGGGCRPVNAETLELQQLHTLSPTTIGKKQIYQ